MKRYFLVLMLVLATSTICRSQEWMTSLDAAQRIAMVQDKFLFVMWEDATLIPYPVIMNDEKGNEFLFNDFLDSEEINRLIWENFVPVKVSETLYSELYDQIKDTRTRSYIMQFEDDNIKIMDVNLNIVNTSTTPEAYFNLSEFMSTYALKTSFLKAELNNYSQQKDFGTTFRLASKYLDYAILVNAKARKDIINLALFYLDEADLLLMDSNLDDKENYENKSHLLRLSQYLLQNRPRKVLRNLKRIDASTIDESNEPLISFLYYTSYQLLKDGKNAQVWRSKVTTANLKKAELINRINF